jgi:steroid 5-alpha reductase family enzyme
MNTLLLTQYILFLSIGYCFFAGLITRNYSQVDRLWSILPPIYVLIWMFDYLDNPRYIIAASIIIFWGIRLTSNFAVKGGYRFSFNKGIYGEDYRWEVLRKKIPNRFLFEIFNLFFISGFQLILIYLFTLPVYYLGMYTGPIKGIEILLFFIHVFLLTTETIADLQQLN